MPAQSWCNNYDRDNRVQRHAVEKSEISHSDRNEVLGGSERTRWSGCGSANCWLLTCGDGDGIRNVGAGLLMVEDIEEFKAVLLVIVKCKDC